MYSEDGKQQSLWIDTASIEWLVAYVCDQCDNHGVATDISKAPDGIAKTASHTAVADCHVWWHYQTQRCIGEFLEGHRFARHQREFGLANLCGNRLTFGKGLAANTYKETKDCARHLLEVWLTALHDGLGSDVAKKHNLIDTPTAVAAESAEAIPPPVAGTSVCAVCGSPFASGANCGSCSQAHGAVDAAASDAEN